MVWHTMASEPFEFEVEPFIGVADLESGRYRLVTHSTHFELDPAHIGDAKEQWARSIEEQGEGAITVESVTFKNRKAGKVESGWISRSGAEYVEEDHTTITTIFKVESPFPFTLLLVAVIVAIIAITAWVFRGEISKIVDLLYKAIAPFAPAFGIVLLIGLALLVAKPIIEKYPRRKGG